MSAVIWDGKAKFELGMRVLRWLKILLVIAIVFVAGIGLRQFVIKPSASPVVLGGLSAVTNNATISIDEAIVIIEEARDSHIIFKWFLENGWAIPTEWTGDIADQNRIIARYTKVIDLLESLKRSKPIPKIKQWTIK